MYSSLIFLPTIPMSVIASWKKRKSLGGNHQTHVKALKTSKKLVVSDDGKKVRRMPVEVGRVHG